MKAAEDTEVERREIASTYAATWLRYLVSRRNDGSGLIVAIYN
jgi:hypothetical protein